MNIAAIITGVGRSAVAVIVVCGSDVVETVGMCFRQATSSELRPGRIRYGQWTGPQVSDTLGESVVAVLLADDRLEIHCHGGAAATRRIMDDLKSLGVAEVPASEVAVWSGTTRLIVEAREILSRCLTARTAAIALDQVRGALANWTFESIRRLQNDPNQVQAIAREAAEIASSAHFTTRLCEPFRVVLVGPPNVGKSSLVNAIVGYDRSITMDVAGTTRDVLHANTVIDGLPIRISDTAGIRESDEAIEREGIARARAAADDADLVVYVTQPGREIDREPGHRRSLRVLNKSDLCSAGEFVDGEFIRTVATTGQGIESLMSSISESLTMAMPEAGAAVVLNKRQSDIVAEIARSGSHQDKIQRLLLELKSETFTDEDKFDE